MFLKTFSVVGFHNHSVEQMMRYQGYTSVSRAVANVLVFTGGVDVHPRLYKAAQHPETHANNARDIQDVIAYVAANKRKDVLKVGICRGAQFLCVMNGGELWQDVDNHRGCNHPIKYATERGTLMEAVVNSTHHQMMRPGVGNTVPSNCERWGWSYLSTYRDQSEKIRRKSNYLLEGPDMEILYYRDTHSLCFQPHPEYSHTETRKLFEAVLARAVSRIHVTQEIEGAC